jgi:galactonate dehydratase
MVEAIETPFHEALVTGRPKVEGGFVDAPSAPGLGIELNDAVARANPYTGNGLHLEMQEAPCDWKNGNAFAGGAAD